MSEVENSDRDESGHEEAEGNREVNPDDVYDDGSGTGGGEDTRSNPPPEPWPHE